MTRMEKPNPAPNLEGLADAESSKERLSLPAEARLSSKKSIVVASKMVMATREAAANAIVERRFSRRASQDDYDRILRSLEK